MPASRFTANIGMLFAELALTKRFAAAAAAGFSAVEHGNPYCLSAGHYRELLDESGLAPILINTPAGLAGTPAEFGWGCSPKTVYEFRESVDRALIFAASIDCHLIQLRSGVAPHGCSTEAALDQFIINCEWAVQQAQTAGVRFTIEALNRHDAPGYLISTQNRAYMVVSAVNSPDDLGIQFDTYHCEHSESDICAEFKKIHLNVFHIQVADFPGRHEPGTGRIPFSSFFRLLDDLGYRGWIGCEYIPCSTTAEGLHWRRAVTP